MGWVIGPWIGGRVLDATDNDYRLLLSCTVVLYGLASLTTWILLKPVEERGQHATGFIPRGPID